MRRTDLLENIAILIVSVGAVITFGEGPGLITFGALFLVQTQVRGWFDAQSSGEQTE